MKKIIFLFAFAFMGISFQTSAQSVLAKNTKRQIVQKKKIRAGVRDGSINKRELRQLKRQKAQINNTRRIARADGVIAPQERRIIKKQNKRLNRSIVRARRS